MYRILYSVIVCFLLSQSINAKDTTNFKIEFPKNVNPKNVRIFFDDGLEQKLIDVIFEKNSTTIKRSLTATYGTISILHETDDSWFRLLVNSKKGYITFLPPGPAQKSLANYNIKNGIDVGNCKEFLDLKKFCKKEFEAKAYFINQYNLVKSDTNVKNYNNSSRALALKAMEFIKGRGDNYFYFWYFRLNIVNELLRTNQLELYEYYNVAFPTKFKESVEGENLRKLIEGNLFIKAGETSPSFVANDYKGNVVSSSELKGKYVLISFWATWCGPCLAEIPMLKKIRKDYGIDDLELISVSCDNDSTAFIKKIAKLNMNWTHIYGNADLTNKFGNKPIPSLYLIDPNGIIQFSSWEDDEKKLLQILKEKLRVK